MKILRRIAQRCWLAVALCACASFAARAWAITVDNLPPGKEWRTGDIEISGNKIFSDGTLRSEMLTETRPWYLFWQARPEFDPVTFRDDLERVRRYYEARGYYETQVTYDLTIDAEHSLVNAHIDVREGQRVIVSAVDVNVTGTALAPDELPIKTGDIFVEATYQAAEQILRQFYADRGFAYVDVDRHAEVNLDHDRVSIRYDVRPGPAAIFGDTAVQGADKVDPEIVLRELTYKPGETFSATKITQSQDKIIALDLFSVVRILPKETNGQPTTVPMLVEVREKEPREINLGVGYGTEERFRTRLEWRDNNFFGSGRRATVGFKYSAIAITGELNLIQPYLFGPENRGILNFRQERNDEPAFLLNGSRFFPRIERTFSEHLTGFIGYRLEYDRVDHVTAKSIEALGGLEPEGLFSGPAIGLVWNTLNNRLNPTSGELVSFTLNQAGKIWGGRYSEVKGVLEGRKYFPLVWDAVLATKLRLGLADPLGRTEDLPIFERFFAGGDNSVRGYGRWRLGPLSASNDPIGGLSLIEGSFELRRPIWGALGGNVFLDYGQISKSTFDIPIDRLRFSAGFGASYQTPVGPVHLDIGFPFNPPRGDRSWQIHVSVGAGF